MGIGGRLKGLVSRRGARSDDDFDDDLDDDGIGRDDAEPVIRRGSPMRRVAVSLGALGVLAVLGSGAWYMLSGENSQSGIPRVMLDVPPKSGAVSPRHASAGEALSPPPNSSAAQAHGEAATAADLHGDTLAHPAETAARHGEQPASDAHAPAEHGDSPEPKTLNQLASVSGEPGAGVVIPGITLASFGGEKLTAKALPEAPVPILVENSPAGPLPRIGPDGRQPWQVYAAPRTSTRGLPQISVLVEDLGLSDGVTAVAIETLPGSVSLVMSPYAKDLPKWIAAARRGGHEVFLGVPMEPERFPAHDAGPLSLQTVASASENAVRLDQILAKGTGYVGVAPVMGGRFLATLSQVRPLFETLKMRGLMYVDTRGDDKSAVEKAKAETLLPFAKADARLDESPSRTAIEFRLSELEGLARQRSGVLVSVKPYPLTLRRIAEWSRTLEAKNLALVPVSALARGGKGT